ncbi:D-2-hydroxyacid dehydrogenase [Pararhodobacter oceanensis]|uniref:D-2-hydroxyacid dehydrogenase n=1 Tax=Pararhodobacter oceanensis TaxID=2172121 RepID=UPI003A8CE669
MPSPKILIVDTEAAFYAAALREQAPGAEYLTATSPEAALPLAADAQVILGLAPRLSGELLRAAPRLEWVQALTTGVDNLLAEPALKGIALTNAGGFHGPQMSELAILMMLSCARDFQQVLENQKAAKWERWKQPLLRGKTVCIVGIGAISETLAGMCNAFGMRVTGVSDGRREVPGFAAIYTRAALSQAAAEANFLVVLTPYSPQTHHIINAETLNALPPHAYLINLSRGGCVDEAALLAALQDNRIAGAGLDVFATEPLPESSPFWSLPNVIVTPHIGGFSDVYAQQALPIVAARMKEYLRGGVAALSHRLDRS